MERFGHPGQIPIALRSSVGLCVKGKVVILGWGPLRTARRWGTIPGSVELQRVLKGQLF